MGIATAHSVLPSSAGGLMDFQLRRQKKAKEAEKKLAERMLKDGKLTVEDISKYFPALSGDDINELADK